MGGVKEQEQILAGSHLQSICPSEGRDFTKAFIFENIFHNYLSFLLWFLVCVCVCVCVVLSDHLTCINDVTCIGPALLGNSNDNILPEFS